jgi:predicted nucleic acid-binding protein
MAKTDDEPLFIDTNVLVYASVPESPFHNAAREAIFEREQAGVELWVSRQVLREYIAVLTRPQSFSSPVSPDIVTSAVRQFQQRFLVAEESASVTDRLLALVESIAVGGRQVHDANIVATMQAHGIARLLTHNISDFQRYSNLITLISI